MPLIAWVDQPLLVQCTRYLWSLDWGDIPFSGLSVSVCGGRKGAAPDSQAATIPEGAWFSLIPGPASGAPGEGGCFCQSQLLGMAFPSSRTPGQDCVHPGNRNLDS